MSIIAELKRRNVFRVGAAYAIVAWLLLEVASVVFPGLHLPDWTLTFLIVLVVAGFPLALVVAWAFELTPEGIKRETAVDPEESITKQTGRKLDFIIIGVLAIAVVYFAVDKFAPNTDPVQGTGSVAAKRSIAVLPFVNMSSDPEQEYFSDGLSEEILNLLAKIHDLKVIGRTSSFAFKGKNEDLREIGEVLGVNTVLEGSVRKSGDRVRVTAQLIDVSDGSHLWSETYDRTLTDIFAVQDDVASAIIEALQIHVGAAPARGRPTENAEAYALFLKARAAMNVWDAGAEELLLKAIALDPKFAEAHQLLATYYWWNAGNNDDSVVGQKRMYDAAVGALAVDPSLLFAQALRAAGSPEVSWLAQIEAMERVTRQEPSNTDARQILVWSLIEYGYFQEAVGHAERFVEIDPLSAVAHNLAAGGLFAIGRRNEAIRSRELASELGLVTAEWDLGMAALFDQRDEDAIAHFEATQKRLGRRSAWVRELVTGARNPKTGQVFLDQFIPQIIASVPEEIAFEARESLEEFYLPFGFLDRYFEVIFRFDPRAWEWSNAEDQIPSTERRVLPRTPGISNSPTYTASSIYGSSAVRRTIAKR
jgi:TolB-like protein